MALLLLLVGGGWEGAVVDGDAEDWTAVLGLEGNCRRLAPEVARETTLEDWLPI